MAASFAPSRCFSASSYPPGMPILDHASQEFRSPDDEDGAVHDSVDATRRRSSARGLERRAMAWAANADGMPAAQNSLSDGADAASVGRTGRGAAAAAGRRSPQRRFSPPTPPGSPAPPARPSARSRPLASTPTPATTDQMLLSSRRPRRDVARPVSYEEPSLSIKMRK